MKKHHIAIAAVLAVLFASFLLYAAYTETPTYSLERARKAVVNHDPTAFRKYVDVDGVMNRLFDQMFSQFSEAERADVEWENVGEKTAQELIAFVRPNVMKATKHQIMNYIETGSFNTQSHNVGANTPESLLPDIWRECGGTQSVFDGIESVQVQGQLAYAALKFRQKESGAIIVLDVKLEDKGGYWQVVELTGLPECVTGAKRVCIDVIAKRKMLLSKAMGRTLVLESLKKTETPDDLGIGKMVIFDLKLKNESPREIDKYAVRVTCKHPDGRELASLSINNYKNISPGETGRGVWLRNVKKVQSIEKTLYDIPQSEMDISADIQYIKFAEEG